MTPIAGMKTRRPTRRAAPRSRHNPTQDDRDYTAEIGRKLRDARSFLQDQIADLREEMHDLDAAWKEWDIDYLERKRYITKAEAKHLRSGH